MSDRAWRRRLARRWGAHALGPELGPAELRALRRDRLRDVDPSPPAQPLRDETEPERDEHAPTVTQVHWVEVVLVGEDDLPIPNERYEIELPDGRVVRGRLDREGKVRIDGIEQSGPCKVTFPDLDQDAWTTA